jgi:peptidoglycan/xylan/chitin deacetylase (PgdA/CDA1 family)
MGNPPARRTLKEKTKAALTNREMWRRLHLNAIARPLYGGMGSILALHRVRPDTQAATFAFNQRLEITPVALDSMLEFLRHQGRAFVTMDEAHALVAERRRGFPWIAITLDDGYRDNLVHALPVFEKHDVPFTLYVTTCFPDHTAVQWWYVLEETILANSEVLVEVGGQSTIIRAFTLAEKNAAFRRLGPAIAFTGNRSLSDQVSRVLGDKAGNVTRHAPQNALSWEDITFLARHPLVTIGAHTSNHLSLAQLDEHTARAEISESIRRLRDACGINIEHFAYPYGGRISAGSREFRLAREMAVRTAVTTREANIFPRHAFHLESLPRIGITMEMLDPRAWALDLWLSGLVPLHENHFKRTITE